LVIKKEQGNMKLKIQLVRDGKTLFEFPLSAADWSKQALEEELKENEESFERLSKIFSALSHATRLRMMSRLVEADDRTLRFADFMQDLDLNPKIVWENSRKLEEGGLLEKTGRGKYACSEFGETFMMMSLALRRLIESIEQMEGL
jgi:DNA-binding transcriptional ArsR family regulator